MKKRKLKKFGVYLGLYAAGVVIGNICSAVLMVLAFPDDILFSDITLSVFWGAFVLAPFEMTLGFSPLFKFYGIFLGMIVLIGMALCVVSFIFAFKRDTVWSRWGVFVGFVLWSLGNIPVFYAFMSV